MSWQDWLWEAFDNGLYVIAAVSLVLLAISAGACPAVLLSIRHELVELRAAVEAKSCRECNCRKLLPLLPRRIGEEAD